MTGAPIDETPISPRESQIIGLMMHARDTLPDEFYTLEIVQVLAGLIARNEGRLTSGDCAVLVGIGGYVARLGQAEVVAGIEARIALQRAAAGADGGAKP